MSEPSEQADQRERQAARSRMVQLPGEKLAREMGKVYTGREGNSLNVDFTVRVTELPGAIAEKWKTGLALDGSASMKDWYGRNLTGTIPPELVSEYRRKKWVQDRVDDGQRVMAFAKDAYADAIQRGHLKFTQNIVEPFARQAISYLVGELDATGKSTVIYWACGDGGAYEVIGDIDEAGCQALEIRGPKTVSFGRGTKLAPAVQYFAQRFADAPRALYVFITDGKLDDLEAVKRCTTDLAKAIEAQKRNPLKCVLVGVGEHIDENQMTELDDLDTGTSVDIWDHKIAQQMGAMTDLIIELVEDTFVSAPATVYDATGQVVHKFPDGFKARECFTMPASSGFFELEVGGRRIKQTVVVP